jgi:hypothetical protein
MMAGVLQRNGVDAALIRKSAYGIDLEGFTPRTRDPVTHSRPLAIGFIGTLAPHKGCHVLVDAFKQLSPGCASLQIYGNPADFPEYFSNLKAAAGDTPGIYFRGTFPNARVAEVVDGLDVLVVPSLWFENTPLVVYSALASRAPVIASDFPGMSEVVLHERNGMLFSAGDSGQLAQQLNRLLVDRTLLPALSAACRPPKSSVQYTDELIKFWKRPIHRNAWQEQQKIVPVESCGGDNYLVGWAVAGFRSPRTVSMFVDGTPIASTKRFLPRPDVRDTLRAGGHVVNDSAFGFQLTFPSIADRANVEICIEPASGDTQRFGLSTCARGASVLIAEDTLFGLDDERFANSDKPANGDVYGGN